MVCSSVLMIRTRQRLLMELSAWYIRHSIAPAAVVKELGKQLPDLLSAQTVASIASLGPGGSRRGEGGEEDSSDQGADTGWLEYVQQAINRR